MVLNSRDWSEIIWVPKILRFKINLAIGFIRKKPTGMHWFEHWLHCKNDIVNVTGNIKSRKKDNVGIGSLRCDGVVYIDNLDKANVLNRHFSSVFTTEDTSYVPTVNEYNITVMDPIKISPTGVAELLSNIKPFKASGPDNIPAYLLKELASQIAPSLTVVFQASLNQCKLPTEWKVAHVVPVFKKGSKSSPNNYRPISLTCLCSKILEHIVYSNIFTHLNQTNILCEEQHGFREKRSCESQLTITIDDFARCLNNKGVIHAIFLDFSKAFDKVPHKKLCHKLASYGITGPILEWILDFLSNRTQRVLVGGQTSYPTAVLSGVPQGTVSLLFLCYVNDLPRSIKSKVRMYADDTLLYNVINKIDDCIQLQHDLLTLEEWANVWQMQFNPAKCEFLVVTNKKNTPSFTYYINEIPIKAVPHAKYLGVTIDSRLSWKEHIKITTHKANTALAFLRRNLKPCSLHIKTKCYLGIVRPIIEYACTVWAPHSVQDIAKIEMIQRRAARFVHNNYSYSASVSSMLKSLGWPTLQARRNYLKLLLTYKILNAMISIPSDNFQRVNVNTRRHISHYQCLQTACDSYRFSFFPSTIKLWNCLPADIASAPNYNEFIMKLEKHLCCN